MNAFSKLTVDLPDLPILAFLSQMSANDRLAAHQVCPSWFHRAREVNQTILPSLTIVVGDSQLKSIDDYLNLETLHEKDSVKLLYSLEKDSQSQVSTLFPSIPLPHRHTPWNCLTFKHNQMTEKTDMQILTAFPRTTELTFLIESKIGGKRPKACDYVAFDHLVTLLTTSKKENDWKCQLTSFQVAFIGPTDIFPGPDFYRALNALTILENLDLSFIKMEKEELSILSQLKKISLNLDPQNKRCHKTFVHSMRKYAFKNEHLTVNLSNGYNIIPLLLFNTSTATAAAFGNQNSLKLSHQIVHTGAIEVNSFFMKELYWSLIKPGNFPNLVSVSLCCETFDVSKTFATLGRANLRRLRHLAFYVNFNVIIDENGQMHDRPVGSLLPLLCHERPLALVQALDLSLSTIFSHAQLRWLNLGGLLPNVKAVSFYRGDCAECRNRTYRDMSRSSMDTNDFRRFTACLRHLLSILALSTGLPHKSITCSEQFGTVEELLAAGDDPLYNKFT